MTDYVNDAKGNPLKRSGGSNAAGFPQYTVWENTFDAAARNLLAADTVSEFLTIPKNTFVQAVFIEVVTTTGTITVDVGDATDPNGWVAAQSGAVAGVFKGAGAYAAAGKLYTADTDLSFAVAAAAATVFKFRVIVVGVNVG